jgi:hypothetical protein
MNGSSRGPPLDRLGIDDQPARDVDHDLQAPSIARNGSGTPALVRRIVQRALKPLLRRGLQRLSARLMTNRAKPVARSQRIGLRLYAIALEPTCSASNGSSTCFIPASKRMSLQNLCTLAATPASV